jgi:hypothetical protein
MSGEALRGDLPDHVRLVERVRPGVWYQAAFRDPKSGAMTPLDPGAGTLPLGWRLGEHEQQEYHNLYFNDETEKEPGSDPWLTSRALRERGIPVRTFKLV